MKTGNFLLLKMAYNAISCRRPSPWFSFLTCCRIIILIALLSAGSISAQQVATGYSSTKGNFETDADYYTNIFQFPDTPCVIPAGSSVADDWIGPALNPAVYGTYPFGPFPVATTGFGRVDSTGAAAFKASIGCTPAGGQALNQTHLFTKNFDSLQAYIVPAGPYPNSEDTMVLIDAFIARDHYGLSGNLDQTTFTGQSNKNTQDPSTWTLGPGTSGPNKNDLIDVGVALDLAFNAPKYFPTYFSPFDFTAHGFATTLSTNGDSHIDAEIFKTAMTYSPGCNCMLNLGPDYGHSAWTLGAPPYDGIVGTANPVVISQGDLLISADYANGGVEATIALRIWLDPFTLPGSTSTDVETRLLAWNAIVDPLKPFNFGINQGPYKAWDIDNPSTNNFGYFEIYPTANEPFAWARVNSRLVPLNVCNIPSSTNTRALPHGNLEGSGAECNDSVLTLQNLEVTIDDSRLGINLFAGNTGGNGLGCEQQFGSIMYKTRTSTSFTAELKDFAGPFPFVQIDLISLDASTTNIDCDNLTGSVCVDEASATTIDPLTVTIYGPAATAAGPFTTLVDSRQVPPSIVPYCVTGLAAGFYQVTAAINAGCDSVIVVEIEDNTDVTDPVITCPPTININCGDQVPACLSYADFITAGGTASDASGIMESSFQCSTATQTGGTCGSIIRTYSIEDSCGNESSCEQTIEIDNIPVQLTCPDDSTVASCLSQAAVDAAFADWLAEVSYSGGCNASISNDNTGAPLACGGSATVTWTVESDCESDATCSATFTVTDAPAVSLTCPDDSTVASCLSQAAVDAAFADWLAEVQYSGGCGSSIDDNNTGAPLACGGSTTVTWTVSSDCESDATCSATFTVTNAPAVSLTCPDDSTVASCLSQAAVDAAFADWLAEVEYSGGCGSSIDDNNTGAPLACGGSTTVTWTVSSDCESDVTCSATFTVTNAPAVSLTCPDDSTVASCLSQAAVDAAFADWLAEVQWSGGCGASIDDNNTGAPLACGGSTTVTWTVSSDCESDATCSATFTVTDAPAVSLTCPDDSTVDACGSQAAVDAAFADWLAEVQYSGGCGASIDDNNTGAPLACGGSTTVTWTVSSDCEADVTCSATFTVGGPNAVSLTCPDDSTVASCLSQAAVDAAFADWLAEVQWSGGCGASIDDNNTGAPLACGGSTTVTWTVSSDCESDVTCSATFTVTDAPAVSLTCPDDSTVASCLSQAAVDAAFADWLAEVEYSGGCGSSIDDNNTGAPLACGGSTTVTWTVSSDCESDATCSATFTVTNAPAVSLTCPDDSTVASCLSQAAVDAAFADWLAEVEYSGGCGASIDDNNTGAPLACGGSTTVTWTVSSDCESDVTCSATFTVTNAPAVSLTCPDDSTVASCLSQAAVDAAFADWLAEVEYSGGCGASIDDNNTGAPLACGGSTTVTWTVSSDCESDVTCSATFTVTNAPAVSLTCPDDSTVASCLSQAAVDAAYADWLAEVQWSGGCNASISNDSYGAPSACGGSATVYWTVSSDCEDDVICSATFTVTNAPAVSLTCPDDSTVDACGSQAAVDAAFADWLAEVEYSGGCGASIDDNNTGAPLACGGSTTVTWTVSSDCEADVTCSATFTVGGPNAVQLTCPDDSTVASCLSQAAVDAAFADWLAEVEYSGGCGSSIDDNNTGAPLACGGSTTVTWTVSSDCESDVTCSATFTVTNAPAVVWNCPAPFTAGSCSTQAQIDAAFALWLTGFTSSGGCNRVASYGSPVAPNRCGGSTTVTYTVTSSCEATRTCASTFAVTNAPAVVWNCPAPFTAGSCSTQAQIDAAFASWLTGFTSSGGCNRVASYGSPVAPNRCGGSTTVTYTVTSSCEATRTCASTFTVTNAPAVVWNCPAPFTAGSCSTQAQIDAAFALWLTGFTSSGGCNRVASYGSPVAPNRCGGSTTVTYTVTSSCEATRTCASTFAVTNAPAVVWNCPAPFTAGSCSTQAQIDAAFASWLTGFTSSGGCNRVASYGSPVAPNRCGGSTTVTYTVTSSCEATRTCASTFTVTNAPAVVWNCPAPLTTGTCSTQAQVNAAFNAWLLGFTSSGGCNRVASYGSPVAPNRCGGTTNVTYTVTSSCEATRTCSSSFTVPSSPSISITCPANRTVGYCQGVQTFSPNVSGGCSPTTVCVPASGSTFPVGTTTVTCTATDACNSNSCSFTINRAAAPTCALVPPTIRPNCGSTGNQLCVTATGAGPLTYTWTKVSGALWSITNQNANCITYTAGSSDSVVFAVRVTDIYGCYTTCTTTFGCRNPYWGCTLGFWKNHTSIWNDASDPISVCIAAGIASMGNGYSGNGTSSSLFRTTFGLTNAQMTAAGYPVNMTLLQALQMGGGTWGLLARSGVAALLNSCGLVGHFYYISPTQVITAVHNSVLSGSAVNANATGNIFQQHNETQPHNCPPAGPAHKREIGNGSVMANDLFGASAYPNPFTSTATIEFEFAHPTAVVVAVYNLNGDKVAELYNGNVEGGQSYKVQFNGENLPSGVYIYKIDGGDVHEYDKIVLMK